MALVFMDGFDDLTNEAGATNINEMSLNGKWQSASGSQLFGMSSTTPYGDSSGRSLRFDPYNGKAASIPFTIVGNKVIFSFWLYHYRADNDGYIGLVMLKRASDDAHVFGLHGDNSSYNLYWRWGAPSSAGETNRLSESVMYMTYRTWHHIAIEVELATSNTGSVRVFRDGIEVDSQINIRTADVLDPGNSYYVQLGYASSYQATPDYNIDDLVVMDGSGSACNTFNGILRCLPLYATSDISQSAGMTASSGGAFFEDIDEQAIADSDASFVTSPAVGDLALYGIADLSTTWPAAVTVEAVEVLQRAATGTGGDSEIRAVIDDGTNQVEGDSHQVTLTGPAQFWSFFETAPDGAGWTVAKVDSLRIGHKKIA